MVTVESGAAVVPIPILGQNVYSMPPEVRVPPLSYNGGLLEPCPGPAPSDRPQRQGQAQLNDWPIEYWEGQPVEQELATKMLQIQSKRFYLDVKQNRRGRFIKVAEIGADGRRSQIFLALSTAAEFRDHLSTFSEYYSSLGPPNPENVPDDGKLKSEMMIKENRRYYLDLKENARGRFLRVSQTITRGGGPRSQIAIPAQGMIEFRDALTDLLEEFGTDDGGYKGELPDGRHMRVDNKNFYFDIGQNNRGIYMRISEVKANFRTAITVPEKSWARFRDIFADYCDKMKNEGGGSGGGGGGGSSGDKGAGGADGGAAPGGGGGNQGSSK
ncbi:transcriptional activator protein Pur-beta isoform X4 [Nilaparvata lugens]|uniref:transcriptional activator protein Pur-beta isoform X4 n=1 Tax=Nilaparvata lugens TaxID=108931 RepID=UPI00193CFB40|nr:transcriptional activator protein Pur-beta isoform X4 [Nilaparvata lugens]